MVDGDGVARAEAGPAPLARAEHRAGMRWRQRGRRFCRRYGYDLAVEQCPDEARELVSTRGHRHVAMLAALDQPSVQVVLPSHRAVGQRHQVGRLIRSACSQGRPDMDRLAAVLCSLRQRRPQASIAGSREAAALHYAARGLARRQPQIAPQLLGRVEALEGEQLRQDRHRRHGLDATEAAQLGGRAHGDRPPENAPHC